MQMMTLLPKVTQFFDLTADWASFSFDKANLDKSAAMPKLRSAKMNVEDLAHESTASEKEDDVLSFVPRRRGSRPSSPAPPANVRESLKREMQNNTAASSGTSPSSSSDFDGNVSTDGTSTASLPTRVRRPSPTAGNKKSGPVARLLQDEAEGGGIVRNRRASDSINEQTNGTAARRASDLAENAVAASAFVQAHDLLKRRREDAVADLGSSAIASSESD